MQTIDKEQRLLNLLGMAAKANKIISGDFAINKAVAGGNVKLLMLADDIAQSTGLTYKKIAETTDIRILSTPVAKFDLGYAVGKSERAAIAVCDEGFAKAFCKILT